MAKEVWQKSKRLELKKLTEAVVNTQEQTINQMKQWRTARYPKAPSTPVA